MTGAGDAMEQARGRLRQAEPRHHAYDVVVVGSGLGGLSVAALLANAGERVLVVERGDGPGGCAHAFRRGPYLFDPAVHFTQEAAPGGFLDLVYSHLGVTDLCEFARMDHAYGAVFPDASLAVPSGLAEAAEVYVHHFPGDSAAIRRFFELVGRFFEEAAQVTMRLSLRDLDDAVRRFPTFFAYRTATVTDVLDEHFTDAQVKAACAAIWPYFGLPPSQISFYQFAQSLSVLLRGTYYSKGSFQRMADAFVAALERDGGELLVGTEVTGIIVEHGRVRGVRLADGERVGARVVVSNADPLRTFEDLVGLDALPDRFVRRLQRLVLSLSAFLVCAATTLELDQMLTAHETVLYDRWDHEDAYRAIVRGEPAEILVNAPTLADPTLAPDGEHLLILGSLAPYDRPWSELKHDYAERVLTAVERRLLPGLREHLTFVESATPLTIERFTGNRRGAIYGWALTPDQTGSKRLAHDTPIEGLYLSGAWTHEGPGSFRVVLSGVQTARQVLARAGRADALPSLRPTDLSPVDR